MAAESNIFSFVIMFTVASCSLTHLLDLSRLTRFLIARGMCNVTLMNVNVNAHYCSQLPHKIRLLSLLVEQWSPTALLAK